jgi:asparagine synthase (glutamine-hydrolysing)
MRRGVLAFAGGCPDGFAAAADRHDLRRVETCSGLTLYAGRALKVRRLADGAIVVGDMLPCGTTATHSPVDGWGNFLVFTRRASMLRVERAPLTGSPLYWSACDGGTLVASHLALVDDLSDIAIDWEFVAHGLAYRNLRTERTGLVRWQELLPGSRLLIKDGRPRAEQTWSPWRHVADSNPLPLSSVAPGLEQRLLASAAAWVEGRPDIVIELSGGLDSSIVTAALSETDARMSAINFVTPGADGDERHFARAVSALCDIEMLEVAHDDRAVALTAPPAHRHFRPGAYAVLGGIDRAFNAAIGDRQVSVFGGIGGDNVFGFDSTVAPILDAAAQFGLGGRTFRVMRDVARAANASLWDAARLSWRAWRKGSRRHWERDLTFLASDHIPSRPFVHPWDEGAESASLAKRNHVEAIRRILDFLDRPERWYDRDVVAPLLSQPVVEYCLQIPSWTWISGGRDRAVARAAFANRLPSEVVWRRGKGRIESLCVAAYLCQRPALRDLLLGGRLASRGLLDLAAIEAYFARGNLEGNFDYFRLLEIADVERWVRSVEAEPGR